MKIKVCGNRSLEDVKYSISCGVDAIGVISGIRYTSEDAVDPKTANALLRSIPPFISTVLVTHLNDCSEILQLHSAIPTQVIQLQDHVEQSTYSEIYKASPGIKIIQAIHVENEFSIRRAEEICQFVDAILLDSRSEERIGGTGKTHDWRISAQIVKTIPKPVILAGGLDPDNIGDAIRSVHPYAVDVNSGLDDLEGNKDLKKIKSFVQNANRKV